jgi:ATP/ADP translocase
MFILLPDIRDIVRLNLDLDFVQKEMKPFYQHGKIMNHFIKPSEINIKEEKYASKRADKGNKEINIQNKLIESRAVLLNLDINESEEFESMYNRTSHVASPTSKTTTKFRNKSKDFVIYKGVHQARRICFTLIEMISVTNCMMSLVSMNPMILDLKVLQNTIDNDEKIFRNWNIDNQSKRAKIRNEAATMILKVKSQSQIKKLERPKLKKIRYLLDQNTNTYAIFNS